jgi:hypothetical protein
MRSCGGSKAEKKEENDSERRELGVLIVVRGTWVGGENQMRGKNFPVRLSFVQG